MRKINNVLTIALTALAVSSWPYSVHYRPGYYEVYHFYWYAIPVMLTLGSFIGWALVTLGEARGDGETRCRKCSHILRGISQPRCPECGEPI